MASFEETQLKAPLTLHCLSAKTVFALFQLGFIISWVCLFFILKDQADFKFLYLLFIISGVSALYHNEANVMFLHILIMFLPIHGPISTAISRLDQSHFFKKSVLGNCILFSAAIVGIYYLFLCTIMIKYAIIKKHYKSIKESEDSTANSQNYEMQEIHPIHPDV